jgi:HAE1 family hydrophobic/amphiphilic exporter-1
VTRYLGILSWSLDHRRTILVGGLAVFAGSLGLASLLPSDFVPVSDRGRSVLSVELPPGTTLAETDDVVQRIQTALAARREVESVYASIGTSLTGMGPGAGSTTQGDVRRATITANLVPRGKRDLTQQAFENEIGAALRRIPGARVRFGADGSSGAKIEVALASDDPERLAEASRRAEREIRGVEGLSNVASTANLARPEILIRPKPDKAAALGVTAETISQVARVATLGDVDASLPKFNLADRQIPIRLILVDDARADENTIANLRVPMQGGGSVPLSAVADVSFGAGPSQIDRLDRRRSATIEGELSGLPLGEASARVHALPALQHLPDGVVEVASGDAERMVELFAGFGVAFGTGVLLMYVVLALLFKGFAHPLTILTALPLSFSGAFGLLLLFGRALSLPALIGILMLMGIAAKNSILLVEYAITARAQGQVSRRDALLDAGRKRARPIVMTTFAMGAGMLPIALGFGADVEFRSPMAIAVLGGLITSTVLSLVFVPVAFSVVDDAQTWLARRFGAWAAPQRDLVRSA